jgi:hypothetical protein
MAESKNDIFSELRLKAEAQDAKRTTDSIQTEANAWMSRVIDFGKYKGKNLTHADMYLLDRSYFLFLVRQARGYNLAASYMYDHIIAQLFPSGVPKRATPKKSEAKADAAVQSVLTRSETVPETIPEPSEEGESEEAETEVVVATAPAKKRARREL